jgi:hypothetical protein
MRNIHVGLACKQCRLLCAHALPVRVPLAVPLLAQQLGEGVPRLFPPPTPRHHLSSPSEVPAGWRWRWGWAVQSAAVAEYARHARAAASHAAGRPRRAPLPSAPPPPQPPPHTHTTTTTTWGQTRSARSDAMPHLQLSLQGGHARPQRYGIAVSVAGREQRGPHGSSSSSCCSSSNWRSVCSRRGTCALAASGSARGRCRPRGRRRQRRRRRRRRRCQRCHCHCRRRRRSRSQGRGRDRWRWCGGKSGEGCGGGGGGDGRLGHDIRVGSGPRQHGPRCSSCSRCGGAHRCCRGRAGGRGEEARDGQGPAGRGRAAAAVLGDCTGAARVVRLGRAGAGPGGRRGWADAFARSHARDTGWAASVGRVAPACHENDPPPTRPTARQVPRRRLASLCQQRALLSECLWGHRHTPPRAPYLARARRGVVGGRRPWGRRNYRSWWRYGCRIGGSTTRTPQRGPQYRRGQWRHRHGLRRRRGLGIRIAVCVSWRPSTYIHTSVPGARRR